MNIRGVLAVGLSLAILIAGAGPVASTGAVAPGDRAEVGSATEIGSVAEVGSAVEESAVERSPAETGQDGASNATAGNEASGVADHHEVSGVAAQYKVSLDNVTVRTWLLRNSTVRNATVEEVVIENATTPDGARENVTLSNVTVGTFVVDRGRLLNVTATRLVVRNRSVLNVPGGDLFDPDVENRTINRQWTQNTTVAGVVIDRLRVDAAFLCGNASLGPQAANASAFDPAADDDAPAVTVQNGTAEEALIIRGAASNWSVGSVDEPPSTNASLPQGCSRG